MGELIRYQYVMYMHFEYKKRRNRGKEMKFKYRRADKGVLHVLIAMQFEFSYKFLCKYLKLFQ